MHNLTGAHGDVDCLDMANRADEAAKKAGSRIECRIWLSIADRYRMLAAIRLQLEEEAGKSAWVIRKRRPGSRRDAPGCGEFAMKHFELRFLDKLDHVAVTRAFVGRDDLAAFAEAERLSDRHTVVEVWRGARKVAVIKNRILALESTGYFATKERPVSLAHRQSGTAPGIPPGP